MKENGHNDLDRLLKEQLGDRQAGVPEFVWEKIEERIYPEKKRRGLFWWWFFGAGLLVTAGVWGVIGMERGKDRDSRMHAIENSRSGATESFLNIPGSQKHVSAGSDHRKHLYSPDVEKTETVSTKDAATRDISEASGDKNDGGHRGKGSVLASQISKPASTSPFVSRDISASQKEGRNGSRTGKNNVPEYGQASSGLSQTSRPNAILPRIDGVVADRFHYLLLSAEKPPTETLFVASLSPRTALHNNTDTLFPLPKPNAQLSRFSILAYGGPSFYDMAAIRPYFETGQLSRRTFAASGFEAGLGGAFRISDRFSVYALGSFNRKQASHQYTLAITEEAYFGYVLEGNKVPLDNIGDNADENCFLATDATATYTVSTWSAAIGTRFTVLRLGKWSLDTDLRFSVNAASGLHVQETTVIALADPEKEHFSWIQPGAGLALQYQLNKRLTIGIAPLYSHRFHGNESSFSKRLDELIVPVTVRIGI